MKKQIISSLILLIVALTTLTVTVFAWFAITNQSVVNNFVTNVTDYSMNYTLEIKLIDGSEEEFENYSFEQVITEEEINYILSNLKPSDEVIFKLNITYTGSVDNFITKVYLAYIEGDELLDEFLIKEGKVLINDGESLINNDNNDYYLSSYVDDNKSILLVNDLTFLTKGSENEIIFTLVFDEESVVQEKELKIKQIRIEG